MKTDLKNIITNIIIVILSIILVFFSVSLISQLVNYKSAYQASENTLYMQIRDGDYFSMLDEVKQNRILGVHENAEYKECYAVADYFEAASLYKAYMENGQEKMAAKYKEKMTESQKKMGDLTYTAEDINSKLGIDDKTQ